MTDTDRADLVRQLAAELILERARDIEHPAITVHLDGHEQCSDLTGDEQDTVALAVHEAIRAAEITVTFTVEFPAKATVAAPAPTGA